MSESLQRLTPQMEPKAWKADYGELTYLGIVHMEGGEFKELLYQKATRRIYSKGTLSDAICLIDNPSGLIISGQISHIEYSYSDREVPLCGLRFYGIFVDWGQPHAMFQDETGLDRLYLLEPGLGLCQCRKHDLWYSCYLHGTFLKKDILRVGKIEIVGYVCDSQNCEYFAVLKDARGFYLQSMDTSTGNPFGTIIPIDWIHDTGAGAFYSAFHGKFIFHDTDIIKED